MPIDPSEQKTLDRLRKQIRREREAGAGNGARPETTVGGRRPSVTPARRQTSRQTRRRTASRPARETARRVLTIAGIAVLAIVAPFFVLLRATTFLYLHAGTGTWGSLVLAAAATFLLLAGYAAVASRRLKGRVRVSPFLLRGLAVLVTAYCLYGLLYLSGAHAKSDAVRTEYRSLHPHLRLALGTLVLLDGNLLVTDASRRVEDYAAMGLPANERSLHLRQADGYAHAADLRTNGRSGLRNAVTVAYFRALGFRTLRHVGTADHLHVSYPVEGRFPGASGSR
ncbi:MAG: hypothetical protein P8Z36_12350 [Gemmatimonadota bacterium]